MRGSIFFEQGVGSPISLTSLVQIKIASPCDLDLFYAPGMRTFQAVPPVIRPGPQADQRFFMRGNFLSSDQATCLL